MKGTEHFTRTIAEYLNQRAMTDPLFAPNLMKPNKNIEECITYILNEVQKSGCNGFDDDEIFSMAVYYYDEDDIEVGKAISCQVAVNHIVELTEEEKAEARQKAIEQYQREELAKLQSRNTRVKKLRIQQSKYNHPYSIFKPMKPRNKFEKAVLAESKHLLPITKTQSKWAFRECIDHFAYRLPKGRTTCMDCGHSWVMNKHRKTCTCPHCRAKLQVKETYERKLQQKQYFTLLTTCGEFQVLCMFLLIVGMEKGYKAQTSIIEIGQYWWNMQGRKTVVAIQRVLGHYVDSFSYYSPMAIRNDNEAYQHIASSPISPKFKVTDILRRNGFKDNFYDIVPTQLIPALLTDSQVETLLKALRYDHLRYFLSKPRAFDDCWQSYKVATRNGYLSGVEY